MHGNLHEVFTQIPMEARPMFRYWFPANAELDLDAIRRDMQDLRQGLWRCRTQV